MFTNNLIFLVASAAVASAQTPTGFTPGSKEAMVVAFGSTGAMGGVTVDKDTSSTAPTVALLSPSSSKTLAIMMIDLDIPASFNSGGQHTLLHWLQPNMTASSSATTIELDTGSVQAYVLQNSAGVDALAEYAGPSPPAMNPLSHRYTQIVIDMTDVDAEGMSVLEEAAKTRLGFDAETVLAEAGVTEDNVVAGNFFNVTNPGPVEAAAGGNGTTGGGSSGGGSGSGNGTAGGGIVGNGTTGGGGNMNNGTVPVSEATSGRGLGTTMFAGLFLVAGAFLGL